MINLYMNIYQAHTAQFSVYPEKNTGSLTAVTYCALGLGEAGELQGKVKKIWRGDKTLDEAKDDLIDELGDVLWYVSSMARELGVTLEQVAMRNIEKLEDRAARGQLQGSGDHR